MQQLKRTLLSSLTSAALMAAAPLAVAQDPTIDRLVASQCAQCHGTDGYAVGGMESLAGQEATNAQAKICADAIIRLLDGRPVASDERKASVVTGSACYSPITYDQASWLSAVFAYDDSVGEMKLTQLGEAEGWSRASFQDMFGWSRNLFADSFG